MEVSNRIEIIGSLVLTECTVQVGTDTDMQCVSSQLANMVKVIHEYFKIATHFLRIRFTALAPPYHHPSIQRPSHHGLALQQFLYLRVAVLAIMIVQRSRVVMASPYRPVEKIHCLPKTLVAQ